MRCPNCDQSLRPCQYEGATIHACDGCHGEFVGSETLREIVNIREETFPQEVLDAVRDHQPSFGVPAGACERSLACPACDLPMEVLNYASDTAVMVDRCSSCGGVWLDADELAHIQAILEEWQDQAPARAKAIKGQLDAARSKAREAASVRASFSRFSFVSELINRVLNRAA